MKRLTFRLLLFSRAAAVAFLLLLMAGISAGSPVFWNITGTFTDGGSLTGWAEFDTSATNDVASDYSLTVSGGDTSAFPPFTFTPGNSFSGGGFSLAELLVNDFDFTSGPELVIFFSSNLTDASSTPKSLISGAELTSGGANSRDLNSATATLESAVPEPSTAVFMGTALASLTVCIVLRRKPRRCPRSVQGSSENGHR